MSAPDNEVVDHFSVASDQEDEAWIGVYRHTASVELVVSFRHGADVAVYLSSAEALRLSDALRQATETPEKP
jgi:hypothetical protein